MVYIETPRLLLRGWKEEDFVPFCGDEQESVCHGILSASFVRGRVPQPF
mgnify:CR=1 FL=1